MVSDGPWPKIKELSPSELPAGSDIYTVVRSKDVADGFIRVDTASRVRLSPEQVARYLRNIPGPGTLLVYTLGNAPGTCVLCEHERLILPDYMIMVRVKPECHDLVDIRYLWVFFNNRNVQKLLAQLKTGMHIQRLDSATLSDFDVLLPPLEVQQALGAKYQQLNRTVQEALADRSRLLDAPSIEDMVVYEPVALKEAPAKAESTPQLSLDARVMMSYPFTIAFSYLVMDRQEAAIGRYVAMMKLFEQLLRFLAVITLGDFFSNPVSNLDHLERLRENLEQPANGHWRDVLQATVLYLGDRLSVPELRHMRSRKVRRWLDDLVQERNEGPLGHGGHESESGYLSRLENNLPKVMGLLEFCTFLERYELIYVQAVVPSRRTTHVRLAACTGHAVEFKYRMVEIERGLEVYRGLYLGRDGGLLVYLHPFLVLENCKGCGTNRIFTYNATKGETRERREYLEYQRGHKDEFSQYHEDFVALLGM